MLNSIKRFADLIKSRTFASNILAIFGAFFATKTCQLTNYINKKKL